MGRSSSAKESNVVQFGQVRIDLLAMEVHRSDRPVSLSAMEFKVLKFFVSNPNHVISRDELLNQSVGLRQLPLHPHGGQSRTEIAAET
jgi:DNA-binding response OmpR family regulator